MTSLVSIIIPNYNGANYLEDCLNSCLIQGDIIKEIIVIDDNSTDVSLAIIEQYKSLYPNLIRSYPNPGRGACSARNYGFKLSSGNFIQFLDSDDFIEKGKIDKQITNLVKLGSETISFSQTVHLYECAGNFDREAIDVLPFEELSKDPVEFLCNLWGGGGITNYIPFRPGHG